jgi:carbonic anhydrase
MMMTGRSTDGMTPDQALQQLREGHERYLGGTSGRGQADLAVARAAVAGGQRPFAVILGCSDSRVPPEIIFDQGLGDLFVVRVAGNIAGPTQVGSIEFAVEEFQVPLIVVLGHSSCGAVAATLSLLRGGADDGGISEDLRAVVSLVSPAVSAVADLPDTEAVAAGVIANVRAGVARLSEQSTVLAGRVADGSVRVVGAEYALDSGRVEFLT